MEDGSFLIPFLFVLGLIFVSGFFSGSETGLTSVARPKIHKLKMEGNKRAIIVSKLREDKERLIGAILLGNNVVNIAASAIATSLAITYLGESGVVYATAIMTLLVLVFAEVLPKTYAVRNAEQVALAVAPMFVLITKILSPFTMAVQLVVDRVISLVSSSSQDEMSGVEVLRGAVDLYHEEGDVLKEDKDMLSGIFDLGDTEIEQIMVHRSDMETINIEKPITEIAHSIANSTHSRFPAWKDSPDNIIGVVHAKDVFKATQNHDGEAQSIDVMALVRKAMFVPEKKTLKNQLKDFQANKYHLAMVVDEFGSVTGMVTLEDIIEEIVGEIDDEHDAPKTKPIRRFKNGSYNIIGDISIRELNRELGWSLSHEDAMTLAGYILAHAQRIPEIDELFEIGDYMFRILKKEGTQITLVKIRKLDDEKKQLIEAEENDTDDA